MSLFQKSVEQKYLKQLDSKLIDRKYQEFEAYFGNSIIQDNIRICKEEQFQEGFLSELFVKILGYTLNPVPNFNLTTEYKNIKDSKKADGAIIINETVKAVIELKGTDTTDLGKVESQAFGYKNNQPECVYIITSNFEKLRFYIDNAIEHIEFNLFNLTRSDFEILYLSLGHDTIVKGIPKKIKEESISQEDAITKKLYQDYSLFKRELHQNLVTLNPQFDALTLFKKSQKLLDRFLFLFFAEDRQLLPPNSVRLVLNDWRELQERDVEIPLYARFKKYFEYLNTGYKGKRYNVFAYNGGLFKPDDDLDTITIGDELLFRHTQKLADYDFASEVDVNILGHIFENSLNELDEIKAQLEGQEIDKTKTKRKKEGIFYTPKYITKYIVENTIGKLCCDKKIELQIIEEEYSTNKRRQTKTKQVLIDKLKDYRNWLLHITICDPACGSGAFLNQALDFLIKEHRYIDELQAKLFGDSLILSDIENSILENNLFGVDLNEESVEIAKLSLWLRTAQPNRKLNDLNNNIKCGNSLIDDPEFASEKAFNWKRSFPQVFENGGFDVVIGNPPYGSITKKETKEYFKSKFKSFQGNLENYCFFTEQFINILKPQSGKVGLIIPLTWVSIPQFENLRKIVLDFKVDSIVELPTKIFNDADLDTLICVLTKSKYIKSNVVDVVKINYSDNLVLESSFEKSLATPVKIKQSDWIENETSIIDLDFNPIRHQLLGKIKKNSVPLKKHFKVSQGIVPYAREDLYKLMSKDKADDIVNKRLWHSEFQLDEFYKRELKGEDVTRYRVKWNGKQWVKYGEWLARPRTPIFFNSPRVLVREITRGIRLNGGFTDQELYNNPGIINIISNDKDENNKILLSLLAIINSRLIFFYHLSTSPKAKLKTSIPKILIKDVENLPIPEYMNISIYRFDEFSIQMILKLSELDDLQNQFIALLESKFNINSLGPRVQTCFEFDFKSLLHELIKARVNISLAEQAELMKYFNEQKQKMHDLKMLIDKTDKEIDKLVYSLYNLTEEEIKIVESLEPYMIQ